ncbi:MAG TPA: hypothetical protein VG798_02405 [Rhizomicrobium sp.]|nr:hypothetical protein [Rhizomicrobium sp.]
MTATRDFRALPDYPSLEHLRKEAKSRHAVLKSVSRNARLSDAQLLVARGYGFQNWPALKAEVDRRRREDGPLQMRVWRHRSGKGGWVPDAADAEGIFSPLSALALLVMQPLAPLVLHLFH